MNSTLVQALSSSKIEMSLCFDVILMYIAIVQLKQSSRDLSSILIFLFLLSVCLFVSYVEIKIEGALGMIFCMCSWYTLCVCCIPIYDDDVVYFLSEKVFFFTKSKFLSFIISLFEVALRYKNGVINMWIFGFIVCIIVFVSSFFVLHIALLVFYFVNFRDHPFRPSPRLQK
ncbi:hypothetical protein EIN_448050 [Entamoeba invadens IP1]|uniref:Uncharacterized protein n=1 Tax=Entamoeba invadens IP1 TaxID=370355 RepID=L7FMJ8_ENTIV|nr:hypothetical protein EIN_448050 [Entamoeba invadens IP1]ELP89084.1 hypothetical protein EIN_448050 [Entamoeba invadens IP1]|eukprot:XP_004255855.1 hypothetical protein EIN_448050 [Entamoeba invadens IP1]